MASKTILNKHEREAADLVVECIGGPNPEIDERAGEYSGSVNARNIDWGQVDEDDVFASPVVQKALRSLVRSVLAQLRA